MCLRENIPSCDMWKAGQTSCKCILYILPVHVVFAKILCLPVYNLDAYPFKFYWLIVDIVQVHVRVFMY